MAKVYFDVEAEDREPRFHYRKGKPPEHYVRVVDILHDRWRTKLATPSVRKGRRIEECRNRLLDYELWLTFITTKSVEDVRETFIRVNEQGMRITSADRAFARASNFNLRNLAKDVQVRLGDDFGKIKFETVLAAAAIAMDETDIGGRALDHLSKRASVDVTVQADLRKVFQSLTRSFPLAQDHLRKHFGVVGLSSLPSETMLAVLAAFFHLNRNKQPSRAVQSELRRWFWGTAIGSRYTGRKFRPCFHADVEVIRGLAARKPKRFTIDRVPLRELRHTDYQQRGTLRDAYFCMLRRHGPRYLEDAVEILVDNPSALGNRNDMHHIFPRKLLKIHGVAAAEANVLANICFLVARENQSVGSKHPREYLRAGNARRARSRAAASHLIPISDSTWLDDTNVKRGFKTFLDARAIVIARRFEVEAGCKLFDMRE